MAWRDILMCLGFAVALPIGQGLFKLAADYGQRLEGPFVLKLAQNWPLMGAFAWYGLTAVFWYYILTRVPLSSAYVFSILGSALVPLIAVLVFREPVSWRLILGFVLMFGGLALVIQPRA